MYWNLLTLGDCWNYHPTLFDKHLWFLIELSSILEALFTEDFRPDIYHHMNYVLHFKTAEKRHNLARKNRHKFTKFRPKFLSSRELFAFFSDLFISLPHLPSPRKKCTTPSLKCWAGIFKVQNEQEDFEVFRTGKFVISERISNLLNILNHF